MARKRKKRHTGLIITALVLLITAAGLLIGKDQIVGSIKHKAAKEVAKELIKSQIGGKTKVGGVSADVSKIMDQMDEEDVEAATDIAEKYISHDSVGQAIDMVKSGDVSGLKKYAEENVTAEDKQRLLELYEKYKDQIPGQQ